MKKLWVWLPVPVLSLLGILIYFFLAGCRFLGLFVIGIACCYTFLRLVLLLKIHHRKAGSIMLWIYCIVLSLAVIAATVTACLIGHSEKGDDTESLRYMILLGAGVNGKTPSLSLQDRIDAAYDYLTVNPDVILIASGGQGPGEDITEAQCIFNALCAKGIDPGRVWLEDQSTSTRENILFSTELIQQRTGSTPEKIGILSSEYHLFRAKQIAKSLDMEAFGIPAKTSWLHLHISYFLREIFVVWVYALTGQI